MSCKNFAKQYTPCKTLARQYILCKILARILQVMHLDLQDSCKYYIFAQNEKIIPEALKNTDNMP